jgi:hypothetical protein
LLTRETLIRQVDDLKRTLQADFSSPLESLVVETITTCFLASVVENDTKGMSPLI